MKETNEDPLLFSTINYFEMISRAAQALREQNEIIERIGDEITYVTQVDNRKDFKFFN
jgi:hypothetical protein